MHTNTIEQFTELACCNSMESWSSLIFKYGKSLGYEQTLLAILPNPNAPIEPEHAFIQSNYSQNWLNKYTAEKMHHFDPAFAHCAGKAIPLIWTPDIFSARKQKEMYEEACSHGLRSGISLPIHGAKGEMGILCFVNDAKPGKTFLRDAYSLLPVTSYLRDLVFETSLAFIDPVPLKAVAPLTPREFECLKWCAAGKSSWDISQILHCSEAAVNFHFTNLRRKFGVKSRQQVVVKAIAHRLISP